LCAIQKVVVILNSCKPVKGFTSCAHGMRAAGDLRDRSL